MKKNINNYLKNKKGSVLVFTLFIMMISLIIGISLMTTSMVGRKSSLSSAKSVNSFQVADSGIEYAFREIREYKYGKILGATDLLDDVFGAACVQEGSAAVFNGSANGGTYKLYFYRGALGTILMTSCSSSTYSRIDQITKIKSVGDYNNIKRSVEATVNLTGL